MSSSGGNQPPAKKAPGNQPPPPQQQDHPPLPTQPALIRTGPTSPFHQHQRPQPTPPQSPPQPQLNVRTTAPQQQLRHPLLDNMGHRQNTVVNSQPVIGAVPPYREHSQIEEAQMAVSPIQRMDESEADVGGGGNEMDKENEAMMDVLELAQRGGADQTMAEERRAPARLPGFPTQLAPIVRRDGGGGQQMMQVDSDATELERHPPTLPVPPYNTVVGSQNVLMHPNVHPPIIDTDNSVPTVPSVVRMDYASDELAPLVSPEDPSHQPLPLLNSSGGAATGFDEEAADDEEDRYKPEGSVELRIEHFSEFLRQQHPNPGESQVQRLSVPIYIRGLPWKILAIPRDSGRGGGMADHRRMGQPAPKHLGYFLQCNGEAADTTWNCYACATLKILSQKEGIDDHAKRISHTFYAKENDWGYSQFISCDKIQQLLDPNNGYIKDDTIILSVDVSADAPHGVQWDSKKHAGHIGLKNQGATCYMNSILQTLFFTNKLRKAVYMMPTEEDDPDSSVALAMQRVFFELQFSNQPVGTKKLTKSFGWDSVDSFLQHDVQELCRVLLDNLESKMKQTVVADTIPSLFKGRMKSYIKCKNVDFESSREESYYDVQLNVKGKQSIVESFKDYTEPEVLDGDNKYDAGEHGLQAAEKGVKFLSFPPVLHLQLMRFQYDPQLDANVKINDRFEFPDELHLNDFIAEEQGEKDDYTYLLHAVLVHSGDFHGGHYVVFINTNLKGPASKWCKFDDDVVSRATHRDAVLVNYGGDGDQEMITKSYSNAYMLVYVRKNMIGDVLSPVATEDIPAHLKSRFEKEKARDAQRKREKDEERLYCEVTMVNDEHMYPHHGFELFDAKSAEMNCRRMKVEKAMPIRELYKYVAVNLNLDMRYFRLWSFYESSRKRDPIHHFNLMVHHQQQFDNPRPHHLLPLDPPPPVLPTSQHLHANNNGSDDGMEGENGEEMPELSHPDSQLGGDLVVYLELARPDFRNPHERRLPIYNPARKRLAFVKFYNHERQLCEYKGPMFLDITLSLVAHETEIGQLIGQPVTGFNQHPFNYYVELKPDHTPQLRNPSRLVRDERYLMQNGTILLVELADKVSSEKNASQYFKQLSSRVDVEAHVNLEQLSTSVNTPTEPVSGTLQLDCNVDDICRWIGKSIDYDWLKIALWKTNPHNEKPTGLASQDSNLKEILSLTPNNYDPRQQRVYKLHYTKFPMPVSEYEHRRYTKVQALYEKYTVGEIALFVEKSGTVQSLLDEAKKEFKFSEGGTGVLRLVHVSMTASCMRVYTPLKTEMALQEMFTRFSSPPLVVSYRSPQFLFQCEKLLPLRIEEVPEDQLEIKQGEHLMPVAHYDKELNRMFGVPFFIKIAQEEPIKQVKKRIRELLEVPEKEFEKYKFTIVSSGRIIRELDDEGTVNLQELSHTHYTSANAAPYLGIDHMNKSRGMRGGHTAEKAIVIHN